MKALLPALRALLYTVTIFAALVFEVLWRQIAWPLGVQGFLPGAIRAALVFALLALAWRRISLIGKKAVGADEQRRAPAKTIPVLAQWSPVERWLLALVIVAVVLVLIGLVNEWVFRT